MIDFARGCYLAFDLAAASSTSEFLHALGTKLPDVAALQEMECDLLLCPLCFASFEFKFIFVFLLLFVLRLFYQV